MSIARPVSEKIKVSLITGTCEGIGFETALALAKRNFKIIMADKENLLEIKNEIARIANNKNIVAKHLDLASFASVRKFSQEVLNEETRLDVLINNAGVFNCKEEKSKDSLNYVMQVNHYSPFLLTTLLLDLLRKSSPSRIIFVTSSGSFFHTVNPSNLEECSSNILGNILNPTLTYYNSKLCNMASSKYFAEKLKHTGVTSNCLHPGMTNSNFLLKGIEVLKYVSPIAEKIVQFTAQDIEISAKMPIFLATSPTVEKITGQYFVNFQVHPQPAVLENRNFCTKIWKQTEKIVTL